MPTLFSRAHSNMNSCQGKNPSGMSGTCAGVYWRRILNKCHKIFATDTALALGGEHENGAIRTQENSGLLFKRILNLQHSSYKEHGKMFHLALDSQR